MKVDDLLPGEAAELRALVAAYAALHARVDDLEARRSSVELDMAALMPELDAARERETALKRSISDRLGEEAELLLPLP